MQQPLKANDIFKSQLIMRTMPVQKKKEVSVLVVKCEILLYKFRGGSVDTSSTYRATGVVLEVVLSAISNQPIAD